MLPVFLFCYHVLKCNVQEDPLRHCLHLAVVAGASLVGEVVAAAALVMEETSGTEDEECLV